MRNFLSAYKSSVKISLALNEVQSFCENPNFVDLDIMTDQDILLSLKWLCCLPSCCLESFVASVCFCISKGPFPSTYDFHYPGKPQKDMSFSQLVRNKVKILFGKEHSVVDDHSLDMDDLDSENPLHTISTVRGNVQIIDVDPHSSNQ